MVNTQTISIDGVDYVRKDTIAEPAISLNSKPYVVIRASSSGVFAGYLEKRENKEVVLRKARRLWYWKGAASLSQMAMEGVSKPEGCKFSVVVDKQEVLDVIEILHCTEAARKNIEGVAIWKA